MRTFPTWIPLTRRLARVAAVASFLVFATPARGAATQPATDSLFAPVAAQQAARLARAAHLGGGRPSPGDVQAVLDAGRVDEAASLVGRVKGDARDVARVKLRVALTRQDFAAAKPLAARIEKREHPSDAELALWFEYLFDLDDAARVDRVTHDVLAPRGTRPPPLASLLAAGRLAYDLLDYDRADSCYARVLERAGSPSDSAGDRSARARALKGLGQVLNKRRDYDGSFGKLREAVALEATPDGLLALAETLIRLGRTDDAIQAAEWAVRLDPYHDGAHYLLGNGYARKNYSELYRAYPAAFADAAGRIALARADSLLAAGDRGGARAAYAAVLSAHPEWADPRVRLASLDFEDGRFESARDLCFEALRRCPEYGRAHATLAKALEFQRFVVDVHRAAYEARFAAAPLPEVPGIEKFVLNWKSLSPRHQKRVALSIAPWKQFIPVLIEGGSSFYIKPLYLLLSETPGLQTLRDTRIDYDSRLWDDVRGAGGFNTVTGIEDVERTIFDRYNTVLHELTHQVHGVLTADQSREIQEHYRRAKARDDTTKNGYLSRYAGGSVFEYFAEGANALASPKRDAWDPREVVRERLDAIDPDLRKLVEKTMAISDVSASYPVAYTNAGDDRVEKGEVDAAIAFFEKALARNPTEETALRSLAYARSLKGDRAGAVAAARQGLAAHPTSGGIVAAAAEAYWHGGAGLDSAIARLARALPRVRPEDRYQTHLELGRLSWAKGDAKGAIAAYDSVLEYQSDNPEALWGAASALALEQSWKGAFELYDRAVRGRTGIAELRCDYARDLIRAGRLRDAGTQLDEAELLDPEHPTAEALRGWMFLEGGDADSARAHARRALLWGEWSDLARIVLGKAEAKRGDLAAAEAAWKPVRDRIARNEPPEYVYRKKLSRWVSVHELPELERELLQDSKLVAKPK